MKKYSFYFIIYSILRKNQLNNLGSPILQELTKNATCIIVSHDPSIYNSGLFPGWLLEKPDNPFIIFNDLMIIR